MPSARNVALDVLLRVDRGGAFAAPVLQSIIDPRTDPKEAALATELVLGVLRRRSWLDRLLDSVAERGLNKVDPKTRCILRIGAYQITFLDRIPARAAVSEAVAQAKRRGKPRLAPLVNALLRRLSELPEEKRRPSLRGNDPLDLRAARWGLPHWMLSAVIDAHGDDRARAIAEAFNTPARRTLRLDTNRCTRAEVIEQRALECACGLLSPWSIDLSNPGHAAELVEQGKAIIQDEGSQLAVLALDPRPGDQLLDACAGRGGKTATIAVATAGQAQITAIDRAPNKLERLAFELARQGFEAHTIPHDLTQPLNQTPPSVPPAAATDLPPSVPLDVPLDLDQCFDRVLLDAPCSGSGTLGRRPEIRWRLTGAQVEALVRTQRQLLDGVMPLVKPGGRLVYSVCSVLPEEGRNHLTQLLSRHSEFCQVEKPPADWPAVVPWNRGNVFIDPGHTHSDGYQLLVLQRTAKE